jgi:hypothetical protein
MTHITAQVRPKRKRDRTLSNTHILRQSVS